MKSKWEKKVVIITGSGAGIGKTLAIEFGKKGANVVLTGRNKAKLLQTASELDLLKISHYEITADVTDFNDCKKTADETIKKYGKINVLINNAGISSFAGFAETSPEVFKKVIDTNLLGVVNMTKAILPEIEKDGTVFFMGSVAGIHGIGDYAPYSCSKMALTSLAESLRIEFSGTKLHIGIAYVGFTENDEQKTFIDGSGKTIKVPSRNSVKQMPKIVVAEKIIRMIEQRKFKKTFTFLGKLNAIMNRFVPFLVHLVLLNAYKKTQE